MLQTQSISTLPIGRQVRELQAALSVNKSDLARILRVSRPTVYDWLDGGEANADNRSRDSDAAAVAVRIAGLGERSAVSSLCEGLGLSLGTRSFSTS